MNINSVTRTVGKGALMVKKYSPEIAVIAGAAGIVTAFGWTIAQAENAVAVKRKKEERLAVLVNPDAKGELDACTLDEIKAIKIESAAGIMRVYAGPVILAVLSLGSIGLGFGILRGRNIALGLALGAVQEKFTEYRAKVREKYGAEEEMRIANSNAVAVKVSDENGIFTEDKFKSKSEPGMFARVFDECNQDYTKDPETNRLILLAAQRYFNDRLIAFGHVWLNEVYRHLNLPDTDLGAAYGWVYDQSRPEGHISFGITSINDFNKDGSSKKADFINGFESAIWLDFNVDGQIYNLL